MNGGGSSTRGLLSVDSARHRRSPSPMETSSQSKRRSISPKDFNQHRSRSASPYDLSFDARHCQGLSSKVAMFNKHVSKHLDNQATNPFSESGTGTLIKPKFDKNDANYGKPIAGSKTDLRGQKARSHVQKEILELCQVISEYGEPMAESPEDDDCRTVISFGELFQIYTVISNTLVGILLRARKHKLVDFEGETLFQKRDDHVPVFMLKPFSEIKEMFRCAEEKEKLLKKQLEEELRRQQFEESEEYAEGELEKQNDLKTHHNDKTQCSTTVELHPEASNTSADCTVQNHQPDTGSEGQDEHRTHSSEPDKQFSLTGSTEEGPSAKGTPDLQQISDQKSTKNDDKLPSSEGQNDVLIPPVPSTIVENAEQNQEAAPEHPSSELELKSEELNTLLEPQDASRVEEIQAVTEQVQSVIPGEDTHALDSDPTQKVTKQLQQNQPETVDIQESQANISETTCTAVESLSDSEQRMIQNSEHEAQQDKAVATDQLLEQKMSNDQDQPMAQLSLVQDIGQGEQKGAGNTQEEAQMGKEATLQDQSGEVKEMEPSGYSEKSTEQAPSLQQSHQQVMTQITA